MILTNGYQTLVEFSVNPGVVLKEKSVTPPGIDGGDPVNTTTMRNVTWRTSQPSALKTLTESNFTAAWDPADYISLLAMININQEITITFQDGSQLKFWGWLRVFQPGEHTDGEQPTATCTFNPGNMDNDANEVGPTYTPPA